MAFKFEISDYIYKYCNSDLPDDEWYEENFFPFIKRKDNDFASDLITLYEFRNTVHLEAEMKKGFDYNLKIAKLAYRRVEGLSINLSKKIPS